MEQVSVQQPSTMHTVKAAECISMSRKTTAFQDTDAGLSGDNGGRADGRNSRTLLRLGNPPHQMLSRPHLSQGFSSQKPRFQILQPQHLTITKE